jgi:hypothetical protein
VSGNPSLLNSSNHTGVTSNSHPESAGADGEGGCKGAKECAFLLQPYTITNEAKNRTIAFEIFILQCSNKFKDKKIRCKSSVSLIVAC